MNFLDLWQSSHGLLVLLYPTEGCTPTFLSTPDNPPTCTRGDNIEFYQWGFDLIPKLVSIIIVTINMYLTWYSLYRQERQTKKFSIETLAANQMPTPASDTAPSTQPDRISVAGRAQKWKVRLPNPLASSSQQAAQVKLTVAQRMAVQSYLYVGAMYITIAPVVVARLYEETHDTIRWAMLYFISLLVPAQGLWNGMLRAGTTASHMIQVSHPNPSSSHCLSSASVSAISKRRSEAKKARRTACCESSHRNSTNNTRGRYFFAGASESEDHFADDW